MLTMSIIVVTALGVLVVIYAVLSYRFRRQVQLKAADVKEELDAKMSDAHELDVRLAKRLSEGKPTEDAIGDWQRERAAILAASNADHPWKWSVAELRRWAKDRVNALTEELRRQYVVSVVVSAVCLIVVTAGVVAGYYGFVAARSEANAPYSASSPASPTTVFRPPVLSPASPSSPGSSSPPSDPFFDALPPASSASTP